MLLCNGDTHIKEELENIHVDRVPTEILLDEVEDGTLKHNCIVDSDVAH